MIYLSSKNSEIFKKKGNIGMYNYKMLRALKDKNMSQLKLSEITGITPATISKIINGLPSEADREKITKALGVNVFKEVKEEK